MSKPVVGICGSRSPFDGVTSEGVRRRYCEAVQEGAGCIPVILSLTTHAPDDVRQLLSRIDRNMLAVHSRTFVQSGMGRSNLQARLNSIPIGTERRSLSFERPWSGVPLFGICRGMQEMNVAFGGDLHQDLDGVAGTIKHREDDTLPAMCNISPFTALRFPGRP